jgi:hypothetical protein
MFCKQRTVINSGGSEGFVLGDRGVGERRRLKVKEARRRKKDEGPEPSQKAGRGYDRGCRIEKRTMKSTMLTVDMSKKFE